MLLAVGEGEEAPLEDAFAMNVLEWLLSNSCAKVVPVYMKE